jgi:chaperonin GroEL
MCSVVEGLGELSKPISSKEEVQQVATISANGEVAIGQLIADAMEKVGKEGVITVQDGKTLDNGQYSRTILIIYTLYMLSFQSLKLWKG